jgi:linoleoyl-CoA desaturase
MQANMKPGAGVDLLAVQFPPRGAFFSELKARVDAYFDSTGKAKTGGVRLYGKLAVVFALFLFSYGMLVFASTTWIGALGAAFLLAQAYVLIGFNVMHDGAHGSASRKPWVNWLMGSTMDLLGSSVWLWRQKHNLMHHTYTNIEGRDDDIDTGGLLRLSPAQQRYFWHRYQAWYAPVLYCFFTLYLVFYSDWKRMFFGRIGKTPLQNRTRSALAGFLLGKLGYFLYALIIPALFHPVWQVLLVFLLVHFVMGATIAVVFQLAHTVEGAQFPQSEAPNGVMPYDWAMHQVLTTANFATKSRLVAFYMGGLNFQIEHHLFHKISHVHYPAISKIVEATCHEFGVKYLSFPSVRQALGSHFRHLHALGRA